MLNPLQSMIVWDRNRFILNISQDFGVIDVECKTRVQDL